MGKLLALACILMVSCTLAVAQEEDEVPLEPKPPQTASEATMLISDAARTAGDLKEVEERIASIEATVVQVARLITIHDAQYPNGVCEFTDDNPTACDPWIEEAHALNSQMDYLNNEHEQGLIEKMELDAYLNMRRARLRIMALMDGLTEWELEVVRCANLDSPLAAQICMTAAWEHHP